MNLTMSYLGHSRVLTEPGSRILRLEPNLSREPVAFSAALARPNRFREAMSSLHDIVVCDLRYTPKDKAAYREYLENRKAQIRTMRAAEYQKAREALARTRGIDLTPQLETEYRRCHRRYWRARDDYTEYLRRNDPEMWRTLMPCDPVITVAPDVVFFEGFSVDESAYGCLSVDLDGGFGAPELSKLGTTNVDYSLDLYGHFQGLRSYRQTRFEVDPQGFEVKTEGRPEYREEKIDLPPGWLRGFMQIQSAMAMPMRKVTLSRECVYSLLAWLKRHRAAKSPRAIRFDLVPGQPPRLMLEPWNQPVLSLSTRYDGPGGEPVRIWGRQRLMVLARVLPLAEQFDVYLLGTGLPSFWVAKMGEMRLTLGLSGWTANDWTRGSALDLLAPPVMAQQSWIAAAASLLQKERSCTFVQVQSALACDAASAAAVLNRLANSGQVIYDLPAGRYRWRQVLPMAVGEEQVGPSNEEQVMSGWLLRSGRVQIESRQEAPRGLTVVTGKAEGKPVELLMDADGNIRRGKCLCGHHFKYGIRNGPCRHLQAVRFLAFSGRAAPDASAASWFDRLQRWTKN